MRKTRVISLVGSLAAIFFCTGCSENSSLSVSEKSEQTERTYFVSKDKAQQIAQTAISKRLDENGWNSRSKVTEVFPIYISGINDVSYWECKVETDGMPSGYVLVTANKADVLVPELVQTGKTLTEQYRDEIGSDDIRIYRYDWLRSAAFHNSKSSLAKSTGNPLKIKGFDSDFDQTVLQKSKGSAFANNFNEFNTRFSSSASASGCNPLYAKNLVDLYYNELVLENQNGLSKTSADWQDIKAELKNYCMTPVGAPWHTAQWTQITVNSLIHSDGRYIGCGPTAWGIVYAYWDAFKSTSALYSTQNNAYYGSAYGDESKSPYYEIIKRIASDLLMIGPLCFPDNMPLGIAYAKACGYGSSTVNKINGTEYNKFDVVRSALNDDRPCILCICADGVGIVDHYVVIEAARKSQTKYLWNWHDRNVYYTVNWGHGTIRKEICVRDWGANQNDLTTSTSLYDIKIK